MSVQVSIIIPIYNASTSIRRCIDSVMLQSNDISKEIIFVDDGSTDDTVEIIQSYHNSDFTVIRQENGGPAKARNTGLNNAHGLYLAFIDADDYWEPTFLEKSFSYMVDHGDVVAVSVGQSHKRDGCVSIVPKCIHSYEFPFMIEDFFSFWSKFHHVCTGSVLLKSDVAKAIGGQREELRCAEDWEFWLMIATYGKWAFIPEVLFHSDGDEVMKKNGWLEKMKPRWESTPTVEVWEHRLKNRLGQNKPEGYNWAIGYVACDFVLSHVLSKRSELARNEVKQYGEFFPQDNLFGKIFKLCSKNLIVWDLLCKVLCWREYHRY